MSSATTLPGENKVTTAGVSISNSRKNIIAIYECSFISGKIVLRRESKYAVNAIIMALTA